jgi:spore germination cell wall hydrolase CwlJ-like protein
MIYSDFDLDITALTVWAEARGETVDGQKAVIHVIKNRWLNPGWWSRQRGDGIDDDTLAAVCLDPYQFSAWNPADPNRAKLDNPETLKRPDVQKIRKLVARTLHEPDTTNGATHYCTIAVTKHTKWAKGRKPVFVCGNHRFYRIGLGG